MYFLGYPYGEKGWKFFDLQIHEFLASRDVVFIDIEFPYLTNSHALFLPNDNMELNFDELPLGKSGVSPPHGPLPDGSSSRDDLAFKSTFGSAQVVSFG